MKRHIPKPAAIGLLLSAAAEAILYAVMSLAG